MKTFIAIMTVFCVVMANVSDYIGYKDILYDFEYRGYQMGTLIWLCLTFLFLFMFLEEEHKHKKFVEKNPHLFKDED